MLTIAVSFSVGCIRTPENAAQATATIEKFYDIPGITDDEISSIEEILSERERFTFGALLSTYAFVLPDGSYAGFFPLLCELLTDLFRVPFEIQFYDWDELNEKLSEYRLDFTGELTPTPERRQRLSMTSAIAELSIAAFINTDAVEIANHESLNGLIVGFWSGSITEEYVRIVYPDLDFTSVGVDSDAEVAEKLLSGEIDAFVAPAVDAYVFKDYPFIAGREVFPLVYAAASMTTANPELKPLIDAVEKYLLGDGFHYIHDLHVKGRRDFAAYNLALSFTDEEKAFVRNLLDNNMKVPIIMESSLYPVTFYNEADNEFQGIAPDILTEITLLTGIEFDVKTNIGATWQEQLEILSSGQAAMLADLWHTDENIDDFIWSDEPYLISNYAFLSKTETPYTDFLIPILHTGVVEGTVFETVYHKLYPDGGNLVLFDSNSDALNALENDEIDLMLTSDFLLLYQTNYREKSGYKVNVLLDFLTGESFFGFNKEEELLRSIISKSQRFVDTDRIVLSWTGRVFDYERSLAGERTASANQRALSLLISLAVLFILLLILGILFRKNKVMIRELRQTSAKLETAIEQANAASKAKSDFLSNMSHEIRTPLNAIVGMTALGEKTDELGEKDYALKKIGDASTHLLGIINDVLDMAKIEADKLELYPTNYYFERMLQRVLSTIYFRSNEKNITMNIDVDNNIPVYIVGDEQRLAQIIMNLLSNAVKFTPVGGRVNFKATLAERDGDNLKIKIEVSDSGIGISPEQQEKLFDAFEQANSGVNKEYGGTGLGLAIAKRIALMMGGQIFVKSEIDNGASFTVIVDAMCGKKEDDITDVISIDSNIGVFEGKRLLVAEDIELNTKILIALLDETGITIDCVENGKDALDAIEANPGLFDIVFMDLQMPVMDGLEATRKIRALPGHDRKKLPIIAMTANVFKEDIENCITAGMDDHLSKPLDIEVVLHKLHEFLLA